VFIWLLWGLYSCSLPSSDPESCILQPASSRGRCWRVLCGLCCRLVSWIWLTFRFAIITWFWSSYAYMVLSQIYVACTWYARGRIAALAERVATIASEKFIQKEEVLDEDQISPWLLVERSRRTSTRTSSSATRCTALTSSLANGAHDKGWTTHTTFLKEFSLSKQEIKKLGLTLVNVWLMQVLSCFFVEPADVSQFTRVGPVQAMACLADTAMRYYWVLHRMLNDAAMVNYEGQRLIIRAARKQVVKDPPTCLHASQQWEQLILYLADDWMKWEHFHDVRSDFTLRTRLFIAVLCIKFSITSDIWKKFMESTGMMFLI